MSKTMSPPTITDGQIGKICEVIGAALRKSGLPSEEVQDVLENSGKEFADECVKNLCVRIEAICKMIVRHVSPDRTSDPNEMCKATGRNMYLNDEVVENMPRGEGEPEVVFFNVGEYLTDEKLEEEYAKRGLVPADPYSFLQVNVDDPEFADGHPCGTHWKDEEGNWCFAFCDRWIGGRRVRVHRSDDVWYDRWWFAGLRKIGTEC